MTTHKKGEMEGNETIGSGNLSQSLTTRKGNVDGGLTIDAFHHMARSGSLGLIMWQGVESCSVDSR